MICTNCGAQAAVRRSTDAFCQFCWDCLRHEIKIRLDAVRDFGEYHHGNCGCNFFAVYYTGKTTLGAGLYLARNEQQAMTSALRICALNNWQLLRLDTQRTLTDIYVSPDYEKYMRHKLAPIPYDTAKYGMVG